MMLEQILTYLHNWFRVRDGVNGIHPGNYVIQDGCIALDFLQDGQYFRIVGSTFNDGLHRWGPEMPLLADETFTGAVWALAVPKSVVELAEEISQWQEKYREVLESPYTSESFGGYSYSKQSAVESGGAAWQEAFKGRLKPYKKMREI